MAGTFLDPLELEYLDGRRWRLIAEFDYKLGSPDGIERVNVPKGFITDFASIPRGLWNVLPPTGSYGKAAVLHDWLYQTRTIHTIHPSNGDSFRVCSRAEADHVLLEAMEVLSVRRFTRWTIYAGVRVGGWAVWKKYRDQDHL